MSDHEKITQEEIIELFGDDMPMEAVTLLQNTGEMTPSEIRRELRKLAGDEKLFQSVARAKCMAVWGDEELWEHFVQDAKEFCFMHRAMLKAEKEQGDG